MTTNNDTNGGEAWTDDRARQGTLPNPRPRSERETRTDRGGSEEFADDRAESAEADDGEQAALGVDAVDDGNQRDLTGEPAGKSPEWAEGDR